ncbi:MAG TPA: BamA/TamA family outer membrane protein [Spirochaetota bacterium]|nr:BamA/TamA family outer membrane protein [Spirochaetota bacterium]
MNFRPSTIVILSILFLRSPAVPLETGVPDATFLSWNTLSTRHFDVHYPAGMESAAIRTAEIAESGYIRVADGLCHEITGIIPLAVYPAGPVHLDTAPAGIRSPFPDMIGQGIRVSFNGSYADLQRSIVAAMTRTFLYSMAGERPFHYAALRKQRLPYWLSEGMARYFADGFDGPADRALRNIIEENRFPGIREMNDLTADQADEASVEGQAFCYFIETAHGKTALGELVREFLDTSSPDDAIRAATGKSIDDLESEWLSLLKKRYRQDAPVQKTREVDAPVGPSASIMIPAVSPDGKKIAALRVVSGGVELLVGDAAGGPSITMKHGRTFLRTGRCVGIAPIGPDDNRISWGTDGRSIMLAVTQQGRPSLLFLDAESGKIIEIIPLPFALVRDPALSPSGKHIVFSAVAGSAENIYLLDRGRNTISRITDDDFSDRYPAVTADGSVIFSTNWNARGNYASRGYRIHRIDIKSGKRSELISAGDNNIEGDISPDGKKLLFISEGKGSRGICVYDFTARTLSRLKDIPAKGDHPRWREGSSSLIFTTPGDNGDGLSSGSISAAQPYDQSTVVPVLAPAVFGESYVDPREYVFHAYQPALQPGHLNLGAAGTMDSGYLCYLRAGLNDYLGRHRLVIDASYLRGPRHNDINAGLAYNYRISRADLGAGIFRRSSPLDVHSREAVSGLLLDQSFGLHGIEHYGGYISAGIHAAQSLDCTVTFSSGRYEKNHHYPDLTHDLRMTFSKLSFHGEYSSERRGLMAPFRGTRLSIIAEHAFDFTGNKHFTRLGIDLRRHFLLGRHFILFFHGAGGTLLGTNNGTFRHYLGGFGSLRGYGLNSISGRNMFLFNTELRITPTDWATFGLPLRGGLGSTAFVLFFDAGSAWNGMYRFVDKKTGRLDDLKMDFGAGLRMAVGPLIILKLDFAWAFDNKSIKQTNMLLGIGFDF